MISANGYHKTTTKEIAKEAGVNESTLYRSFIGKEDIFHKANELERNKITEKWKKFNKNSFENVSLFLDEVSVFLYDVFLSHHQMLEIMLKEIGNEKLGVDKNSIFEESVKNLNMKLMETLDRKDLNFLPEIFVFISSVLVLVVNNANKNVLMDELGTEIGVNELTQNLKILTKIKTGKTGGV